MVQKLYVHKRFCFTVKPFDVISVFAEQWLTFLTVAGEMAKASTNVFPGVSTMTLFYHFDKPFFFLEYEQSCHWLFNVGPFLQTSITSTHLLQMDRDKSKSRWWTKTAACNAKNTLGKKKTGENLHVRMWEIILFYSFFLVVLESQISL